MATFARHVDVEWNGTLMEGNGTATAGTGAFSLPVTFPSRINEKGDGKTTPEELLAGAHVLGIKDMAGLCRPRAATMLVRALRDEIGLPIHFHTHDTSGISAASVLAAVEAGAAAVDCAIDAMSGLTSQPNMGSIVEALRFGPRDSGIR